ncbi:hypothetical protein Psta_2576 [Pirellula staleyi DSM 6068]|uniref:Uncharacterized protein n=1 Tax=Pirellula staleyi (strain ATCC 27377 / DSM 6068 / ICPB 4128) TaxID=530564 RepID=D2R5R3_PIRSD|nr:hypothetical protein [Pirellula staleyi]ADB17245.1 hypothetical protein Psta_2576 [Pirellula staleyi DSM 6068]
MHLATFFYQECPTCGRHLRIRVQYLGRNVTCPHCGGTTTAADSSTQQQAAAKPSLTLLQQADRLLLDSPASSAK